MSARARQLRRAFFGGLVLFVLSILSLSTYSLWQLRSDAITNGLQLAALHARSFENFLTQSLRVTEQTAANMDLAEPTNRKRQQIQDSFVTTLRHTPFLRSISLQDASGRIVASSNPNNVGRRVDTHGYLPLAAPTQEILRLGQPWQGRDFASGTATTPQEPAPVVAQSFIPMTRALETDGQAMTLLMAINPDYFVSHMSNTLGADIGSVEVMRYDGILLMSTSAQAQAGSLRAQVVQKLPLNSTESGTFEEQPSGDTLATLSAFRASSLYPFVVVTRLHRSHVLQQWQTETKTLLAVLTPTLLALSLFAAIYYRRQMEAAEQRSKAEQLLRLNATVFDASSESIIITDADGNIMSVNAAFTRITGYTEQEVQGRNPKLLASGQHEAAFYANLWTELLKNDRWQGEMVNRRKDASLFDAHVSISLSRGRLGQAQHYVGIMTDITERKRHESVVKELNRDFVSFLENTSDFIYFKDRHGRFRFASQTLARVTGHAHWRDMIGKQDLDVFPAETARIYQEEEVPIFRDGVALLNKVDPYFDASGKRGWVSTNKWPLFDNHGQLEGLFGISRDITTQKQNDAKLELAASVFSNSREGILITDTTGTIVDVNDAFTRITGYSRAEVLGENPRILNSGRQKKAHYAAMWRGLLSKGHWYGEVWNRRKSGEVYAEMLNISTVRDAQGQAQHYVALFSDITVAKEHEQQLDHIAHYDTLTNLPNRVLLADRLSQSMAQAQRRGLKLAVVFVDLDGFKLVNDTHGHETGDQLLMTLSCRMKQALREGDTLARIGGDEFVAVLVDLADTAECVPILNRLQSAAADSFMLNDTRLQVSASLGVTFYPQEDEIDADQLQRQADLAMYQAKVSGKNRYHFFDAAHDRSVRRHHESLERVRQALRDQEFVLYYQPKVNLRSGQVIGVEALIRWHHPEQGLLLPAAFLPVIDNHPLAVELGNWVLLEALEQRQTWQLAGLSLPISVNVSARQLQQRDFVAQLQGLLSLYPDMAPDGLQLEVQETSALEDISGVSGIIEHCRKFGVLFALDDFGTGYSSLTYLKRLPVALLKIDQSFVHDALDEPDNLAILQGVIGLAKALGHQVIAEGVETVAQGCTLLQLGCDLAQGFGIAHPMPAQDMAGWLSAWRPDPAWQDTAQDQHPSA